MVLGVTHIITHFSYSLKITKAALRVTFWCRGMVTAIWGMVIYQHKFKRSYCESYCRSYGH